MKADLSGQVRIASHIRGFLERGELNTRDCEHVFKIQDVTPSADGCEDCLRMGDEWVNLRLCLICGHVGCCDSSKNKHATAHFRETNHPMITSYEEGEKWLWCFVDEVGINSI